MADIPVVFGSAFTSILEVESVSSPDLLVPRIVFAVSRVRYIRIS